MAEPVILRLYVAYATYIWHRVTWLYDPNVVMCASNVCDRGPVGERLSSGLQIRLQRFESAPGLQAALPPLISPKTNRNVFRYELQYSYNRFGAVIIR